MKYYEVVPAEHDSDGWLIGGIYTGEGTLDMMRSVDDTAFTNGLFIKPLQSLYTMLERQGQARTFALSYLRVPIVDQVVADTIAGMDTIQTFPVRVLERIPRLESNTYSICNVIQCADCIDESKTMVERGPTGYITGVADLHLDSAFIPLQWNIFRLALWKTALIVSERLRDKLLTVRCAPLSVEFIPVT